MENMDFGCGHGQNFDHLTMVILKFLPWSWSKVSDHMTMTRRRRPNGQKIMVALPPPPLILLTLTNPLVCSVIEADVRTKS